MQRQGRMQLLRSGIVAVACACVLAGCDAGGRADARGGGPSADEVAGVNAVTTVAPAPPRPVAPLEADGPVTELFVPAHLPAVVVVPIGARARKPVVVAAHGRDDRPEAICDTMRVAVSTRAFVVCPRGVASDAREGVFTYASAEALAEEIDAAVSALRATWPDHVDVGPVVYAGFSLGAYQGVRVVTRDPSRTPRAILIEGGQDPWTDDAVSAFVEGGGARVLFATGQPVNETRAREAARRLEVAGAAAKVVHAEGAGHVHDGELGRRIAEAFDWLIEGDPRFDAGDGGM